MYTKVLHSWKDNERCTPGGPVCNLDLWIGLYEAFSDNESLGALGMGTIASRLASYERADELAELGRLLASLYQQDILVHHIAFTVPQSITTLCIGTPMHSVESPMASVGLDNQPPTPPNSGMQSRQGCACRQSATSAHDCLMPKAKLCNECYPNSAMSIKWRESVPA